MLPYFYIDQFNARQQSIVLDEDTSKHIVQVLRMKKGEKINLTDGKGNLLTVEIEDEHKKHCGVSIIDKQFISAPASAITIAVSLIKNTSRFEWFLEKATEIGVQSVIPLICERTETEKFRADRMKNILVSAMLQSQQSWLPVLRDPVSFTQAIEDAIEEQKFIAHCIDSDKKQLADEINFLSHSKIILIGPEGDFTPQEIDLALKNNFKPVTLGDTRLRTETAALVAATVLKFH
ncbi:MAG: RsmE family RNA methyltransferase [Chitinophagaceae bacterium]